MNNKHIGSNFDEFLKEEGIDLEEMNGAFANFIQVVKLLAGQYLSLKAENEKLKKEVSDLNFYIDNYKITWEIDKCNKYKQALEEVREIANEPCIDDEDCETCNENCMSKDIINKINEVLIDEK